MSIKPNTEAFEREILIDPSGFREYDARWLYPEQLNLRGVHILGMALGTIIHMSARPDVVIGHDYRSYSSAIKMALINGLVAAGCRVKDIGLAVSPAAYYAQFALDCPAVAMVTASHNENGWTGVKMGCERPLTFGPEMMARLRDCVADRCFVPRPGGSYEYVDGIRDMYMNDLLKDGPIGRKLRVVVACGNGTAGAYAPHVMSRLGCEVIPLDCDLDYTFPNHNPNPEDMAMLHSLSQKVLESKADIGFAFDGDGDRCGVVDDKGQEIFADKMGVLLARYFADVYGAKKFVVDVKSTALFSTDPVLKDRGVETDYWITGHSYIKRRVHDLEAMAGFEKSGHFFFNGPVGRGYDDGLLSAIMVCRMLDQHPSVRLSELRETLPQTWSSPTMSPHCADDAKYEVVKEVQKIYTAKMKSGEKILGQKISEVITVNGARVVLEDGTWGLIRASSNKPCLVVVVESPVSEMQMHQMFGELNATLSGFDAVGEYDQTLEPSVKIAA